MKILYIANRAEIFSGGEISLLELLWALDRTRYEPVVLVPGEGDLAERIRAMGIEVRVWDMPSARTLNLPRLREKAWELAGITAETGADIMHANGIRSCFYASLASKNSTAALIWHVRESCRDNFFYDWFLASRSSAIICVSKGVARERFSRIPVAKDKIHVIYNGVDSERFSRDGGQRAIVRKKFGIAGADILLGMAGLVEPLKGHELLLRAFKDISIKFPSLKLVVAGKTLDAVYERKLKGMAGDMIASGNVIFAGQRDDMNAMLSALDVLVLPSRREGFSRVVLEAMACSLPVIASDVSGNNEAVINGETGLLVPFGDDKSLARAIESLIDDPEKRSFLGSKARKRVVENFSITKHTEEVQNLYKKIGERREAKGTLA